MQVQLNRLCGFSVIGWLHKFKNYPKALRIFLGSLFLGGAFVVASLGLVVVILLMVFPGSVFAMLGNKLGFNALKKYDQLWNWIIGGDIEETISSRLGKSIFADHAPVFFNLVIDKMVAVFLHQIDNDHVRSSIMPGAGEELSDEEHRSILNMELADTLSILGVPI